MLAVLDRGRRSEAEVAFSRAQSEDATERAAENQGPNSRGDHFGFRIRAF